MACKEIELELERYLDRELTLSDRRDLESHLDTCKTCKIKLRQLESIKTGVGNIGYEKAPGSLKKNIRKGLLDISNEDIYSASPFQWLSFSGGLMFFIAISSWITFQLVYSYSGSSDFSNAIVNAHVRSLQVDHLHDIASTDKHTVKPWFTGKLGFAPIVKKLDSEGYQLTGGRMEYVNNHISAALVYKRRKHWINVFLFRNTVSNTTATNRSLKKNGYNIVTGKIQGIEYWIISDLNIGELESFTGLYVKNSGSLIP